MEKKFCPKCGYENISDAKFCVNCGYKFPEVVKEKEDRGLSVYQSISGILAVIFLIDSLINEVYRTLLSVLFIPYVISFAGIVFILYLFRKEGFEQDFNIKLFIYGNMLAGLGGLIIYVVLLLTGHIIASLYWIIFLVIAYKVNKIRKS